MALVPLLLVVAALFFLQVSPGVNPDGSTRLQNALGYMRYDATLWVPFFMLDVALGSALGRYRRGRG